MVSPYPDIEPYAHGLLDVGDGNSIYWETCGNPAGKPAVVLHGGPGSGCGPVWRGLFDPAAYRVVLFDQRGCGRSTPDAGDPAVDLSTNTLEHLLGDIEALREHLDIERWLVLGASWGTTLGLAYAERHPERVTEAVLFLIALTQPREVEWITRDMGRLFPERWEVFRDGVPEADRDGNLADAYRRLLADPSPAVRDRAARNWCIWEETHVSLVRGYRPSPPDDFRPTRQPLLGARRVAPRRTAAPRRLAPRGDPGRPRARAARCQRTAGHRVGAGEGLAGQRTHRRRGRRPQRR